MKNTDSKMKSTDKSPDQKDNQLRMIFEIIKSLGCCTSVGLAVLDVENKRFACVTEHFLQITNSNLSMLQAENYQWFDRTFDLESVNLLMVMKSQIESFRYRDDIISRFTFSCTLALKASTKNKSFLHYMVTPLLELKTEEQMRWMLISVQISSSAHVGELCMQVDKNYRIYDVKGQTWRVADKKCMNRYDLDLLSMSVQGLSQQEIADTKSVSLNAVKAHRRRLFTRQGVSSIEASIGKMYTEGFQKTFVVPLLRKRNNAVNSNDSDMADLPLPSVKKYDYLIVGAGLYGATFARCAANAGKRCLVIDKRNHVGGNAHCLNMEGIEVHQYGPHIFHTSNPRVWNFVSRFVTFNRFTLNTKARYKGRLYDLPFNFNTFGQLWGLSNPQEIIRRIEKQRYRGPVTNLEEQALSMVGTDVYEALIKGYTEKQWGRPCKDLPPEIIRRLPIRYSFDNNYFTDLYQGIPMEGYNSLTDSLLADSDVETETDFFDGLNETWPLFADRLVYTGLIDRFYDYRYGSLQYRSLRFETEVLEQPIFQGIAITNYTERDVPFTRIVEHKYFRPELVDMDDNPKTVITREYPAEYADGMEPYYPINDVVNTRLYARYKALAEQERNVIFGGRLAEYKYYDMDQTIASALRQAQIQLERDDV